MFGSWILLCTIASAAQTLVLLGDQYKQEDYSDFLTLLKDRGHNLVIKTDVKKVPLIEYEERMYDNVLSLSPLSYFEGPLGAGGLIEFIDQGGNVLLVGDSKISEQQRDFAYEFAVDFDRNKVQDYFNHGPADSSFSDNLVAPKSVISSLKGPILYDGIAHTITGKNPLGINVLAASDSSFNGKDPKMPIGASLSLVSALQALNNARVVFAGSVLMFSNQYLQASVDYNGVRSKTGNKDFVRQISEWVFQEKSVLKLDGHSHHRQGELKQHGIYTINDNLVYEIAISEKKNSKWVPFLEEDVQFEAVMIDPYVRRNLKSTGKNLSVEFKVPDHYGIFTFKVDYSRIGYSNVIATETVQIRPLRHDKYPRFITVAYPYYINIFSMMVLFFIFTAVFLFNAEEAPKVKTE